MKKYLLFATITGLMLSCSSTDNSEDDLSAPKIHNKLKAYDKATAYYSYNPGNNKSGMYRIYLDTISNIITQYTSRHETNQSDISESFGVKHSTSYSNYKNTNIDYITYEVSNNQNSTSIIMFSHEKNTDKFLFKKFSAGSTIIFSNIPLSGEYYKKMY